MVASLYILDLLANLLQVNTLVRPLETVLARHSEDSHLRVSALSILGIACQTCPVALSSQIAELIDWVLNILDFEKNAEVRRGMLYMLSIYTRE
jgi:hypothetical protein